MSEIPIIYDVPVIFTKDIKWLNERAKSLRVDAGRINLLPEDAVLLIVPQNIEQQPIMPKKENKNDKEI